MTQTLVAEATAAQAIVVARSSIWVTDDIHGQVVAYEALTGGELERIRSARTPARGSSPSGQVGRPGSGS